MSEQKRHIRHPLDKYRGILADLRGKIIQGKLAPGVPVSTRRELAVEFGTTLATIHKAISQLEKDGFVESLGQRGTRVSLRPPHLHHIVVAFESYPELPHHYSLLEQAFEAAAARLGPELDRDFSVRYRLDGQMDGEDMQTFIRQAATGRIGGVFFGNPPYWLERHPSALSDDIPAVSFGISLQRMPSVNTRQLGMVRLALKYLRERGRRRVAFLTSGPIPTEISDIHAEIVKLTHDAGLETRPYWLVPVTHHLPQGAWAAAQLLLLSAAPENRPDALVIMDDHLIEAATGGVASSGLRVPEDIEIIAHCNFPVLPTAAVPVVRIGFDASEVLRRATEIISACREGRPVKLTQQVSAVSEVQWLQSGGVPVKPAPRLAI